MKILVAGGTGFIGKALIEHFLQKNYEITVLGRSKEKITSLYNNLVNALTWQELIEQGATLLQPFSLIINLAGTSIGSSRWTAKRKKEILSSRIDTTKTLANLCAQLGQQSPDLFNASAIGVYGLQTSEVNKLPKPFAETTLIDFNSAPDFLAQIGRQWEQATQVAAEANVRVINMRFGVVISRKGGVLEKLRPSFSLGFGSVLGSGNQPFTWVALSDLINAIDFLIAHRAIKGPINIVAPQAITQHQFAKIFAQVLKRPCFLRLPAGLLRLIFGEMAEELLLKGQNVCPMLLLQYGFQFQYPDIQSALLAPN